MRKRSTTDREDILIHKSELPSKRAAKGLRADIDAFLMRCRIALPIKLSSFENAFKHVGSMMAALLCKKATC